MADRDGLLALLTAHAAWLGEQPAPDPGERDHLERMRAYALRLPEPFSRWQPDAHFTGSALVVDPPGARVCLVLHARARRWLQPGGHADPGDGGSLEATAMREAREETGCAVRPYPGAPRPLDVNIHQAPPPTRGEAPHLHLDLRFLLVADDPDLVAHDPGESLDARWLAWDAALDRVGGDDHGLRRLLAKGRSVAAEVR